MDDEEAPLKNPRLSDVDIFQTLRAIF